MNPEKAEWLFAVYHDDVISHAGVLQLTDATALAVGASVHELNTLTDKGPRLVLKPLPKATLDELLAYKFALRERQVRHELEAAS